MIKQRKESVKIYSEAGRTDLKKREEKEIEIIESFLPKQIKADELEQIILSSIKELDCESLKDLGKLISSLKENYPGQIDMREVADLAKKILNEKKNISVDEILIEFNNKSRLSDLISKYVQLTPRGSSFIGKCPFHNEKTPSFNVSDDKGLFHCFGCKVGGNAITFLTKYKNLTFQEAINELSVFAGLQINYEITKEKKID